MLCIIEFDITMSYLIIIFIILIICLLKKLMYKKEHINTPKYMRDPNKLRDNVVTFFFQGNNSSRSQATKYTGPESVRCRYNGKDIEATSQISPRILHNVYTYDELDDLDYYSYNPIFLGLKLAFHISNVQNGIDGPTHIPDITKWSVGGQDDVNHFLRNIKKMIDEHPDKKIVVFGCSRGASTTLIGLSLLGDEYLKKINLVIVEAPFNNLSDVLNSWKYLKFLADIQLHLLAKYARYSHEQLTPIEAVDDIPTNIPIAFITSKIDETVPEKLSKKIIKKMRKMGHEKIHHCSLDNSCHEKCSIDNLEDQKKYFDFVEELYQKYVDSD